MPIYEFYCQKCNVIFNFLSKRLANDKKPACPRCGKKALEKMVSSFASPSHKGDAGAGDGMPDMPIDESKMERALESLASEAGSINENDPKQAAQLMRKFSSMTGMEFGKGIEEALSRLEKGEDPEKIEQEMGSLMDSEDPFVMAHKKKKASANKAPERYKTLYEM